MGKKRKIEITETSLKKWLPHGSGIDATWSIEDRGSYFRCDNSYHAMNDMGFYIGWQDFYIIVPKKKPLDYKLHFTSNRYIVNRDPWLRDYLDDLFSYTFVEMGY